MTFCAHNKAPTMTVRAVYTSKAEGMGMGLSIARTIIEAHNGFISASNREHGGAPFTIRLPFAG
nr:ATP-binding protein [Bradyrhizobium sp. URHA0013]